MRRHLARETLLIDPSHLLKGKPLARREVLPQRAQLGPDLREGKTREIAFQGWAAGAAEIHVRVTRTLGGLECARTRSCARAGARVCARGGGCGGGRVSNRSSSSWGGRGSGDGDDREGSRRGSAHGGRRGDTSAEARARSRGRGGSCCTTRARERQGRWQGCSSCGGSSGSVHSSSSSSSRRDQGRSRGIREGRGVKRDVAVGQMLRARASSIHATLHALARALVISTSGNTRRSPGTSAKSVARRRGQALRPRLRTVGAVGARRGALAAALSGSHAR